MKKLTNFLSLIAIILASVYLTFLIDNFTLNTWVKRIFIFCYFIVVSCFAWHFYSKCKKYRYSVIPLICAVVLVLIGQNIFLPSRAEHTVYIQSVEMLNDEEQTVLGEVWLVDLKVDGNQEQLSKLELEDILGWSYYGEYDDYGFTSSQSNEPNVLSFTAVGEELVLTFGANSMPGNVRIYDENGYDTVLSLSSENTEDARTEHTLSIKREYSVFERILYSTGATIVLWFALKVLFLVVCKSSKRKDSKCANLNVFCIYALLVCSLLKLFNSQYGIMFGGSALFIGVIVLFLYPLASEVLPMFRKLKVAEIVLLFFIVFLITFQTIAEPIFMGMDKTKVEFLDVLTLIIAMAVAMVPVLEITLLIDKHTQNRFGGEKDAEE